MISTVMVSTVTGKRDAKDIVIITINKDSRHYANKEGTTTLQDTNRYETKEATDPLRKRNQIEATLMGGKTSSRSTALVLHYLTTSRPHRKGEPTLPM